MTSLACQNSGYTSYFTTLTLMKSVNTFRPFSADCTWDFFGCTNRAGQWPSNKVCCQARFDACCMKIMAGKKTPGQGHETFLTTSTSTTGPSTGTTTTSRPLTQPDNPPPQHQTQDPKDKIQLSMMSYFVEHDYDRPTPNSIRMSPKTMIILKTHSNFQAIYNRPLIDTS